MVSLEDKVKSVKFPGLDRAQTFYVNRTLPELQVWQLPDRPQTNLTGFRPPQREKSDFFHRSQVTAVPILYRQTKKLLKASKNLKEVYAFSKTTKVKSKGAAKHSKVIHGVLPELSTNQCRFFNKWTKDQDPLYTAAGRPSTNLTVSNLPQPKHNPEIKVEPIKNKELAKTVEAGAFRLPSVQSPTPSAKKGYIMKWLASDINKSPYQQEHTDGRSSRSRSREMIHTNKVLMSSPFIGDDKLPSPLTINGKIAS